MNNLNMDVVHALSDYAVRYAIRKSLDVADFYSGLNRVVGLLLCVAVLPVWSLKLPRLVRDIDRQMTLSVWFCVY